MCHKFLPQNLRSPLTAIGTATRLVALCREFKPNILHAHMMSGAVHGWFASRLLGIPLVTTVHNSFDRHSRLMSLGDRVVAVSRSEYALLRARSRDASRVELIVNGTIGSPRLEERTPGEGSGIRTPSVTTMCGLERRKGVHDVIEAFGRVASLAPAWHLTVVGDGPQRNELEEQARNSGLSDRIHFLGHVSRPFSILMQTEIFVLASHIEPFGLSVQEARQAGCAVVGARVGGIREQLGDGRYGLVVPPGRPKLLAQALARLMTDPQELGRMRRSAVEDLDYFHIERMARDYIRVYQGALRAGSRVSSRT